MQIAIEVGQAIRELRRAPVFALIAILTLGVGLGATMAVLIVVWGARASILPYPESKRIVQVFQSEPSAGPDQVPINGLTPQQLLNWRGTGQTIAALASYVQTNARVLTVGPTAVQLPAVYVSPGLFEVLGVTPLVGRTFSTEEEAPLARVVVLSHRTWVRHFGADPTVVDRVVTFSGTQHRVVGVMPQGFEFPRLAGSAVGRDEHTGRLDPAPAMWLPLALPREARRNVVPTLTIARLRPDVTREQAEEEGSRLVGPTAEGAAPRLSLPSLEDQVLRPLRPIFLACQAGALLVLLMACVNVTGLLLVRANHRQGELALRLALGATRLDITRRAVIDAALLSLTGGGVGCLLALAAPRVAAALPPTLLPGMSGLGLDSRLVVFAGALSIAMGIAIGVVVAARVMRSAGDHLLSRGLIKTPTTSPASSQFVKGLVVAQIGLSTVLLLGAVALSEGVLRLIRVNPGFNPDGLLAFEVTLPPDRYRDAERERAFWRSLMDTLANRPGANAVAFSSDAPLGGGGLATVSLSERSDAQRATYQLITPGFFEALSVPILKGREFSLDDHLDSERVVVVNSTFVSTYFGDSEPLGRELVVLDTLVRVVGVAGDVRVRGVVREPLPSIYFPYEQLPLRLRENAELSHLGVIARVIGPPLAFMPTVRQAVAEIDPQVPAYNAVNVEDLLAESYADRRVSAGTVAAFAGSGFALAMIALYGVMAYIVTMQTKETGIRMALGATDGMVVRRFIYRGLQLAITGVIVGALGSAVLTELVASEIQNFSPVRTSSFGIVAMVSVAVAFLATYIPARRAAGLSLVTVLRSE